MIVTHPTASSATPSLLRSSAVVGAMTTISRVLGLARDVVFARYLGADAAADAFYIAFRIPNMFRRFFAEGAFSQAFVPVLSEYRQGGNHQAVKYLVDRVAGCLGASLLSLTLLCVIAAPLLTFIFASGYSHANDGRFELTTQLIRIMFPYLMLISLAGFLGSILNSYDRFAIPAITPVFLNLVLIAVALGFGASDDTAIALAWGVILAGLVQLGFQWPFVRQLDLAPRPRVDFGDPAVKKVLGLMAPALFGASVSQINLMINTMIASYLPTGSVSWMYYSDRLTELPLGMFGVAIATVILPTMSRQIKANSPQASATLDWALRSVLLVAVPASLALILLAKPILLALFRYGHTSLEDVRMSSYSLFTYCLGLPFFMLIKVLVSGYSSRQDTRTPVKIGLWVMLVNLLFNALFVLPLHIVWQVGHAGLTLATAMAAAVNTLWLWHGLVKKGFYSPTQGWGIFLARLIVAALFMGVALELCLQATPELETAVAWVRLAWVAGLCVLGFAAYVLALAATGIRLRHLKPVL